MFHMTTETEFIGSTEAAKILGVTRNTINRHVAEGKLTPAAKVGGKSFNIFKRDTIESIAKGANSNA